MKIFFLKTHILNKHIYLFVFVEHLKQYELELLRNKNISLNVFVFNLIDMLIHY